MARLQFALWALKARFLKEHSHCPYCGSILHARLQRKKLLIEARKCQYCGLIFRWPTDSFRKAEKYYEREYRSGHVTDLPENDELAELLARGFENSRFDSARYVELVEQVCLGPRSLLDFGASWGYVGAQFARAGYKVEGFELSRSRAEFGRKHLGLQFYSSWGELTGTGLPRFDVVFTAHTLEHVYDLKTTLRNISRAVLPGGRLIIIVPNGGSLQARQFGVAWGPYLGETHTIAFTSHWLQETLPVHGFEDLELFSPCPGGRDLSCDGEELICIARRSQR
jgi:2-polyprenyl-3-methyl-5-hydroxy-6-metoxy-1,4-benzoquinol methylase